MTFAQCTHPRLLACLITALSIAASILPGPAQAATIDRIKSRGTLVVCVNPDAMPYSRLRGGEEGLHIDLANALAGELGVAAQFSWVQYRFQAKYTQCDAFMGVGVLEGEDDGPVKLTKPILRYKTVLATRPDKSISKLEDLDGLRVATQSGSLAHVTLLKRPVDIRVSLRSDAIILDAIEKGDIDVGVVSNVGYEWYLKSHPETSFATSSASVVQDVLGYPIAIGIRKANAETMTAVNSAIDRLVTSGEMKKIFSKYGIEDALVAAKK